MEQALKQIRINEATVTLRADGIVHVLFHRNILMDVKLQMLLLTIYNEITGRNKHPFLFEAQTGVKITREAKENAIRIESEAPVLACAIIAQTKTYSTVANFYLFVKRPKIPYRVFNQREEAISWLQTIKNS